MLQSPFGYVFAGAVLNSPLLSRPLSTVACTWDLSHLCGTSRNNCKCWTCKHSNVVGFMEGAPNIHWSISTEKQLACLAIYCNSGTSHELSAIGTQDGRLGCSIMTAVVGAVMAAKNMRMVALSNAFPIAMLWASARLSMGRPHNLD